MDTLIKTPKTKRGQVTLDKIIDSAEILFCEKGYHETSVLDIANNSGIATGTYYIYFKDKLNLYKYILLQYSHMIRKEISLATADCETRYEKEYVGLKTFLEFINKHSNAYRIIWESQYVDPKLFRNYYEDFSERYAKNLIEAQENGEVIDVDPTIASYVLMGLTNFVGLKWVIFDNKEPNDEVVSNVMKILSEGLFIKK